jgi:uncharacterized membrane protein YgcG
MEKSQFDRLHRQSRNTKACIQIEPEIGKRNSLGDTGMVASDVPIEERIANTESRISNIEERMSSVPFESGGGSFAGGGASGSW